jgi:hypothetical protein
VGITFGRLSPFYWIDNLGFLLREKLAAIFITPCSWGFPTAGHLLGCINGHGDENILHTKFKSLEGF